MKNWENKYSLLNRYYTIDTKLTKVLQNACGTQAILSIVLNRPDIEIGHDLTEFKEFTAAFPSELRGEALSNSGT
jgi:type II restriction/modification system DNA methylase subunit YeeA